MNRRRRAAESRTDPGLRKAIEAKGVSGIAVELGIKAASVSGWPRVPSERVLDVERITGVPRHELRPDLYPPSEAAA